MYFHHFFFKNFPRSCNLVKNMTFDKQTFVDARI